MLKAIALFTSMLLLSGCTFLQGMEDDASARLAVKYATAKVIEKGENPEARAERILRVAEDAKKLIDNEQFALDTLRTHIVARIAEEDLSPADQVLADELVSMILFELEKRIGKGLLSAEQKVTVSVVLNWVVEAAR